MVGRIGGQLPWKRIPVGPSQAMAIQMFAVHMAMKTAIASVEDAVEGSREKSSRFSCMQTAWVTWSDSTEA